METEEKQTKTETIPHFEYWMLTEMDAALQLAYDKELKDSGIGKLLKYISEKKGLNEAKQLGIKLSRM